MKRYLTIVVCAAACLLTLDACDSQSTAQKSLTELKLPDSTTDKQLAQKVKGLTTLKWLDLNRCYRITDAGLAHLKGLTKLEKLYLIGCTRITDAGLVHLKGLTTLKVLDLSRTNITDDGLAHLKGLTNLEKLDLFYCDKITAAGVQSLQKALPDCRIMKNLSIR